MWNLKPYQWTFVLHSIKICCSVFYVDWLCIQEGFCNITCWAFGKYCALSCSALPNTDTFRYTVSRRSHLFISPPISAKILLRIGKLALHHGRCRFSKTDWQQMLSVVPLKRDKLTWIIFGKISARYPRLNNYSLPISLSRKNVPSKRC